MQPTPQPSPEPPQSIAVAGKPKSLTYEQLDIQKQQWVDYNVVQGVFTDNDGELKKKTVSDFAVELNVDRKTLNNWTRTIPNFWELVDQRRRVIFKGARTAKVWNSLYYAATIKLNVEAMKLWLTNADPEFKIPTQKMEHEAGQSMAELMQQLRAEKQRALESRNVVEGEVVE